MARAFFIEIFVANTLIILLTLTRKDKPDEDVPIYWVDLSI